METALHARLGDASGSNGVHPELRLEFESRTVRSIKTADAAVATANAVPVVFLVDDDACLRDSLAVAIRSTGWHVRPFRCVQDFLSSPPILAPSCLVVDVATLDVDDLELQDRVSRDRPGMPIVLVSRARWVPTTVQARSPGAVKVLSEPVRGEILRAIAIALERSLPAFHQWLHTNELRTRYGSLSCRERQVMALVVSGRLNKQVGFELGISEITVKAHRGSIMRKMQAASLASLVGMAIRLGLAFPT